MFLLKARVSYLTILAPKNLSLPLKDETDQWSPVWFYQCLSTKIAFYPRTVKRILTAQMPSFLFHCFSLLLPHLNSSPREKIGKLSSFCFQWFGSLFVSIIVAKYNIFPRADNGRSREKKIAHASASTIGILTTLTYTEFDCTALLAML